MKLLLISFLLIAATPGRSQTVTGTGTLNYIPKFSGASTVGNSILYTNGTSIGIGTTAPVAKLEIAAGTGNENIRINGSDGAVTAPLRYTTGLTYDYPALSYHAYKDNGLEKTTGEISFADRPGTSSYPWAVRTSDIWFKTAHNWNGIAYGQYLDTTLAINANQNGGYVGIGVTAPLAKLDVNGNLFCRSIVYIGAPDVNTTAQIASYKLAVNGTAVFNKAFVKLYGNWPDYVFADDYKLLPLADLKKYVALNKHLPDVPTATETLKEGIDLGSNQAVLLKKIEELTLYILELDKKIEALTAKGNKTD